MSLPRGLVGSFEPAQPGSAPHTYILLEVLKSFLRVLGLATIVYTNERSTRALIHDDAMSSKYTMLAAPSCFLATYCTGQERSRFASSTAIQVEVWLCCDRHPVHSAAAEVVRLPNIIVKFLGA